MSYGGKIKRLHTADGKKGTLSWRARSQLIAVQFITSHSVGTVDSEQWEMRSRDDKSDFLISGVFLYLKYGELRWDSDHRRGNVNSVGLNVNPRTHRGPAVKVS